jgi:hypothetical protein
LLTEHELTRVLQMLGAIQRKMGIDDDEASQLADLEMETKPEDVPAENRAPSTASAQRERARVMSQNARNSLRAAATA